MSSIQRNDYLKVFNDDKIWSRIQIEGDQKVIGVVPSPAKAFSTDPLATTTSILSLSS